jgi:hypothetical protein
VHCNIPRFFIPVENTGRSNIDVFKQGDNVLPDVLGGKLGLVLVGYPFGDMFRNGLGLSGGKSGGFDDFGNFGRIKGFFSAIALDYQDSH